MNSKRKTAPVAEHSIFTDELPAPIKIRVESADAFFARVRKQARDSWQGRFKEPVVNVSFESAGALPAVLTRKRYAIFKAVKKCGGFESIEALASELRRDRATVGRDLKALADAGPLRMREAVLPGHGWHTEIAPMADGRLVEIQL